MFVAWVAVSDVVEEAAIDLINNFEMAREQRLEQLDGPLLQGFGKQGMVGVSESALRQVPGLVPSELPLVEQYAHQFRNRDCGVSVVELDRRMVRQGRPFVAPAAAEAIDNILERAAHHEVLLQEAQGPAGLGGIVGIKNSGQGFRFHVLDDSADEVAVRELGEIEGCRSG